MKLLEKSLHVKRISPPDGEYFFGYYDLQPFNGDLHLTHKVDFVDRLQVRGDTCEVGVIDMTNGKYEKLDTTGAWNFQQGAMLQWNQLNSDEVIYNSLIEGGYNATVLNIKTGTKRYLDRPVANVSLDGKWGISINFPRLYNFRPGYGYAEYGDKFYYHNHSEKDGVFIVDMQTGKSKLVLSMQEIWDFSRKFFGDRDEKMCINHITFNTDASRFIMLVRNFPQPGKKHDTALITANRDGSDMFLLSDYGVQSHYHWRDREHIIFFAGGRELGCAYGWGNNYLLKDKTHEGELVMDGYFDDDNHMSYSPDRKLILTDSYPDEHSVQHMWIYNIEKNVCAKIGRFYSIPRSMTDMRCDLHPRWNRDGSAISFDSTHEGFRGVYKIDIADNLDYLFDENKF